MSCRGAAPIRGHNRRVRLTSILRFLLILLLCAGSGACSDSSPASPSNSAPFSQTDLRVGTGTVATSGQTLTVNYTGWFFDTSKPDQKGLTFDSSIGKTAFSFTLGAGQVIEGWERGVPGMQVGGLRRLVIPPSLAYGATRSSAIPANTTLLFEIALLDAK
jgi:FKBP-type peptidyl-prolyl cis-trans isomerase FkpA